ncbi:phage holin family protein [Aneurinibacillus uraniidurans]|uniref:phage holin family protein n=1 Tax=Aneurinibacillus uraniidurans TaxID=2966586 RepID=UPI00234A277B|nr:phage holin family protein [Aneurinibacillus sp. B1]WCN39292.1 phage holin family protein [Aneurinibacillus sp. B1]
MKWIWHWVLSAVALLIVAWLFNGIWFDTVGAAFMAALVLGVINTILRPILKLLALPITILTFGIFSLVINAAMLTLAGHLVSGFHVSGFFTAFFASIVLSIVSSVLYAALE